VVEAGDGSSMSGFELLLVYIMRTETYVHNIVPMLGTSMLDEARGCLDCSDSCPFWQNEFAELGKEMASPSISRVDHCSGTSNSSLCLDRDPTVDVAFRNTCDWSMGLQTQVVLLKEDAQKCMHKFIWPARTLLDVTREDGAHRRTDICPAG
jgi:hypothetical protein